MNKKHWIIPIVCLIGLLTYWLLVEIKPNDQRYLLEINPDPHSLWIYEIDYESKSAENQSNGTVFLSDWNIRLKADMQWSILNKTKTASTIDAVIVFKEIVGLNHLVEKTNQQFPFQFRIRNNGKIENLVFKQQDFAGVSAVVIDILRHFEQDFPSQPVTIKDKWRFAESNLPSPLLTENSIKNPFDEKITIVKAYQTTPNSTATGHGYLVLDLNDKLFSTLEVDRESQSEALGSLLVKSRTTLKAKLIRLAGPRYTLEILANEPIVKETMQQERLVKDSSRRSWEKLLGRETFDTLLDKLIEASENDKRANMKLYQQLKALFHLHPESCIQFLSVLLDHDIKDDRFKMIATALTAAGNEEAQEVLREAIESTTDPQRKMRLIPNLSFTEEPSIDTQKFLEGLSESGSTEGIRDTAALALGTVAFQLRDHSQDRANELFQRYSVKLDSSSSKADIVHNLSVLGNMGLDQQVEEAKPYLESDDVEIERKATDSLRHSRTLEAQLLLIQKIKSSKDSRVQELASQGLVFGSLEIEVLQEVVQLLRSARNLQVLKNLVRALANNLTIYPEGLAAIKGFSDRCGHPDLCGFVRGLVSSLDS